MKPLQEFETLLFKKLYLKIYFLKKLIKKFYINNKTYLKFLAKYLLFQEFCYFGSVVDCNFVEDPCFEPVNYINRKDYQKEKREIFIKKEKTISKFKKSLNLIENSTEDDLLELLTRDIDDSIKYLKKFYTEFEQNIKELTKYLYNIKEVYEIFGLLDDIGNNFKLILKNKINSKQSISIHNIKPVFRDYFNYLIEDIDTILVDHITQFDSKDMSIDSSLSVNSSLTLEDVPVQDRLNIEVAKQKQVLEIRESELMQLKHELLLEKPDSVSEREAFIKAYKTKEEDLKLRVCSLQELEHTIADIEKQTKKLSNKKIEAEEKLADKMGQFQTGVKKLIELNALIAVIYGEVKGLLKEFNNKTQEIDRKIEEVMASDLSPEEKARIIKELQLEKAILQQEMNVQLTTLTHKHDELTRVSKMQAKDLEATKHYIIEKHLLELEELEASKIGATPSKLLEIEEEIRLLKERFNKELQAIEHAKIRKEYFEDDYGRYFINDNGEKIYQSHSNATQYKLTADGIMEKIQYDGELFFDNDGQYYFKKNGEKVYTSLFFEDEFGKYYIDSTGERIYKAGPDNSAYKLVNGVFIKIDDPKLECVRSDSSIEREADQEYIKRELGTPLRLALASLTTVQPIDPINYLANYLLQYRYNEIRNKKQEQELCELLEERERVDELIQNQPKNIFVSQDTNSICSPCEKIIKSLKN